MIYPAVVISAMIGIGILMLIMVVPQIASTFEDLGIELPITTQFIINIGVFMAEKWYLVILLLIVFVLGFLSFAKTKRGKKIIDTVSLKLPIISPIVRKTNAASTVRTLGSLISAGVPIVRSLEIVAGTLGNIYFRNAIAETAERVRKGAELSNVLKDYDDIYPSSVIEMIKVGEETGETSKILSKLADYFEEEVTAATQNLASVIEPLLMLIVGAVIGFFAISMIQPMYSMLEGL
jgi:type II secretory pathway component PulF